jgi:hypothetical protein
MMMLTVNVTVIFREAARPTPPEAKEQPTCKNELSTCGGWFAVSDAQASESTGV